MPLPPVLSWFQRALGDVLTSVRASTGRWQRRRLAFLLQTNRYPLIWASDIQGFAGPGWDAILQAVQESHFLLLGEDHGTAQTPLFTQALARAFEPAIYVAELDPYQAQELAALAARPEPPTAYLQQRPGGLSFYGWPEEFALVRALLSRQVQLVGIDQVFLASTGEFYTRMAAKAHTPAAKSYLLHWAAVYQAQDCQAQQEGTAAFSMLTQSEAAIDELLALVETEALEVRQMARDYAVSYRICQAQVAGTGGHQKRVNLLKRNLLQALRLYLPPAGQPLPKLLVKFGALHVARNVSPLLKGEYFDVGNLVQNLADVQEQKSLHLFIIGKQGAKALALQPDDPAQRIASYTARDIPFLKVFFNQTHATWQVFDLRPARQAFLAGELRLANRDLLRTILGYDFLVTIPETTASGTF